MRWEVICNIFSPDTGTIFAYVKVAHNLKMVLWYGGDCILSKGDVIETVSSGLLVNGKKHCMTILHIFPFSTELWKQLVLKCNCPGNTVSFIRMCKKSRCCRFILCPYGIPNADTRL